jgi:hypothetical protein
MLQNTLQPRTSFSHKLSPVSPISVSNSSGRRVINPALELQRILLVSARLEEFAESGEGVGQHSNQHEAGEDVLRVWVHGEEVGGRDELADWGVHCWWVRLEAFAV